MSDHIRQFRTVFRPLRGWKHKWWVQIYTRASVPFFMTWYDINQVTPERCEGFRSKKEALAYIEELETRWGKYV